MGGDPFYWSKKWRAHRAAFLARHPICQVRGCELPATVADHKVARSRGGADFPADEGLNALCAQHHNRKTRTHDQPRKIGEYQHVMTGSAADGLPLDPDHHWNK